MNYYKILELPINASIDDIKKRYKQLAIQYHPDKNNGSDDKFKEVNEAYKTLGDPELRKLYDKKLSFGNSFGRWSSAFGKSTVVRDFGNAPVDNESIGENITEDLFISIEDSIFGCEYEHKITRSKDCPVCNASGIESYKVCPTCSGKGKYKTPSITLGMSVNLNVVTCKTCNGIGKVPNKICDVCNGSKKIHSDELVKVVIPVGIKEYDIITIKGKGAYGKNGCASGDRLLKCNFIKTDKLYRVGNSVYYKVEVNIIDLIIGGDIKVHLFNKEYEVNIPSGSQLNTPIQIGSESECDIFIIPYTIIPTGITPEQETLYKQIRLLDFVDF